MSEFDEPELDQSAAGPVDRRAAIALAGFVGLIAVGIIVFSVTQRASTANTFDDETRETVVEFCVDAGGDDEVCGCFADRVGDLPFDEFEQLDGAVDFGQEPAKDVQDVVAECRPEDETDEAETDTPG